MHLFPSLKNHLPFRIGTSSYIIPADIIPNVNFLASVVDDIELILFESPDISNLPSPEDIALLKDLSNKHSLSYTVHLPIDRKAGSIDKHERDKFCESVSHIKELCNPLSPTAWILHLEGILSTSNLSEVSEWQKRCHDTLTKIIYNFPSPESVVIENLNYPWEWHKDLVSEFNTSYCCDVGHLWLYSPGDWQKHFISMLPRTKVIHLHGVSNGKDHIALSETGEEYVSAFFDIIKEYNYQNIITLEIFNEQDLLKSLEVTDRVWVK